MPLLEIPCQIISIKYYAIEMLCIANQTFVCQDIKKPKYSNLHKNDIQYFLYLLLMYGFQEVENN